MCEKDNLARPQSYRACGANVDKYDACLQAAAKAKKVVDKEKKAREGLKKLEVGFAECHLDKHL